MTDVQDPRRLEAVRRSGLLDSPREAAFDRMTRLASHLTDAPIALISVVDRDRQFFKSSIGLPEELRETPLSHSFCQHVVERDGELVVTDSRADDLVRDNLAIEDLQVEAYCGVPLRDADGEVLGAFCVIDTHPREWTETQQARLDDLVHGFHTEMRLRRAVDELERRNEYLRMVVHDLRAPLTIVTSVAKTLGSLVTGDETAVETLTAAAERHNERMNQLIDGLLAAQTLDEVDFVDDVDLRWLVERIATDVSGLLRPGQRVRTEVPAPISAPGNAALLEQALLNLIGNAIVHNKEGVTVTVSAEVVDDRAAVTVEDDGQGLAGARRKRGPFHGLGLNIARRVVEAHGGEISLASPPGGGAAVRIELPLALSTS